VFIAPFPHVMEDGTSAQILKKSFARALVASVELRFFVPQPQLYHLTRAWLQLHIGLKSSCSALLWAPLVAAWPSARRPN